MADSITIGCNFLLCGVNEVQNLEQHVPPELPEYFNDWENKDHKTQQAKPHDWWRVEVKLYDGTLLAIEPEMLSGKSDLTERDLETIRVAGRHLLGFAGT